MACLEGEAMSEQASKDWQIAATEAWDRPGVLYFRWWRADLPLRDGCWIMLHRLGWKGQMYSEYVSLKDPTPEDAVAALQILRDRYDAALDKEER